MDIRLKPELGKLVEEDVQRGPYQTADESMERAVMLLHEHEAWLAEHASEIGSKVSESYAAAKRGELIDAEEGRLSMELKKRTWLADKRKA